MYIYVLDKTCYIVVILISWAVENIDVSTSERHSGMNIQRQKELPYQREQDILLVQCMVYMSLSREVRAHHI